MTTRPEPHAYQPPLFGTACGYPECGLDANSPVHRDTRFPIDADENPVGRYHPANAREMGARMRLGTKKRLTYDYIAGRADGATAEEVGDHFGWQHQSYSAACARLKAEGHIRQKCEDGRPLFRLTSGGNDAAVWERVP